MNQGRMRFTQFVFDPVSSFKSTGKQWRPKQLNNCLCIWGAKSAIDLLRDIGNSDLKKSNLN